MLSASSREFSRCSGDGVWEGRLLLSERPPFCLNPHDRHSVRGLKTLRARGGQAPCKVGARSLSCRCSQQAGTAQGGEDSVSHDWPLTSKGSLPLEWRKNPKHHFKCSHPSRLQEIQAPRYGKELPYVTQLVGIWGNYFLPFCLFSVPRQIFIKVLLLGRSIMRGLEHGFGPACLV